MCIDSIKKIKFSMKKHGGTFEVPKTLHCPSHLNFFPHNFWPYLLSDPLCEPGFGFDKTSDHPD